MLRAVGVLLVALLLLGGSVLLALRLYDRPGPLKETRAVMVPRGTSLDQVADLLAAEGVVSNPTALRLAALVTRGQGPIKAGELAFPPGSSLRAVLLVLRFARPVQHRLTIPEGLTAAQVAMLMDRTATLDGPTVVPEEGSVMPETYAFERGTPRAVVLERATKAMERALAAAWAARAADLPLAGPREALTLASIVERETSRADERPRVAAVFLNRLRRGMRLQSDPTVVYGVSGGLGVLDHGLTRAELDRDTPYNTYRIPGLPPGPIAMPGPASLTAVTQPWPSEELYFVADGNGGHVFARTEAEHNRNVARWREFERQRAVRAPSATPAPARP